MKTMTRAALLLTLVIMFGTLAGCGGGTTHGATNPDQEILVHDGNETRLDFTFPDGTSGGGGELQDVANRLKVEHSDSLGFVGEYSRFHWALNTVRVISRAQHVIRIKRSAATRSAGVPYNVALVLGGGDTILITDSAADPSGSLAVGYQGDDAIIDAGVSQQELAGAIEEVIGDVPDRHLVAQSAAIVALAGWSRY